MKAALVLGLALAGRQVSGAVSEWVQGLPPSVIAERMALAQPQYVSLSHGSEVLEVWVVRGWHLGERRAAVIAKYRDGTSKIGIRDLRTTGSEALEELRIPVGLEGSRVAVLGVGLLDNGLFQYEWRGTENVGSLVFGVKVPHLQGSGVADSAAWDSDGLRDQVVVLNWWMTSCVSCVEEHPALDGLVREFADESMVHFVAISPESRSVLAAHLRRHPFAYEQVSAPMGAEVFGERYPRHVVLDRESRVVLDLVGAGPDLVAKIRAAVRSAIAAGVEPRAARP